MSREKDIPEELDPSECWSTSSPIAQVWAKARLMTKGREEADSSQQTQWFYFFRVLGTVTATEHGDIAAFQTSFPSYEESFSKRPQAVKGGPTGAGGATPLTAWGRFEMIRRRGKEGNVSRFGAGSASKRRWRQVPSTMVLSETRGL